MHISVLNHNKQICIYIYIKYDLKVKHSYWKLPEIMLIKTSILKL